MALLRDSGIPARLDEAVGFGRLGYDRGQIALRRAHNAQQEEPPEAHIDGLPTPYNGVPADVLVSNFTVLAGVFLSPVRHEFAGNFTVWPGSHHLLQAHFREYGPEALRDGMPQIPLGAPVQLMAEPGDVVLCHYGLAHAAAVNLSDADRYAVYFRLWLDDIEDRRWHLMTHIWDGWRLPAEVRIGA
jgi:ectoine hydroxylase-related dioxygenase (phytanoyl-CoA dioxygenase family)